MTFTTQTTDALCLTDVKKCRTKGFRFNPLDVPQRNAWSEERATKKLRSIQVSCSGTGRGPKDFHPIYWIHDKDP